jgi:hypothetical protein
MKAAWSCGARCASRVESASLLLLIARHEAWLGARGRVGGASVGGASDATHSRVAVAARSGAGWFCGGPELGGAARGWDLRAGRTAGERERVERSLDVLGGAVVLQGV